MARSQTIKKIRPETSGLGIEADQYDELVRRFMLRGRTIDVRFRSLASEDVSFADRLTHQLHPYPARLLPQIAHFFLSVPQVAPPGGIVLDPFAGSGTVLVEARAVGLDAVGVDSNPFARLLTQVKCEGYADADALQKSVAETITQAKKFKKPKHPDVVNLEYWYTPAKIKQLSALSTVINRMTGGKTKRFLQINLSAVAKLASKTDPRLSVPVRLNPKKLAKKHWLRAALAKHQKKVRTLDVFKEFESICLSNIERLRAFHEAVDENQTEARIADITDARKLSHELTKESVDLVLTSPPYPGAQKYIRASSLSIGWLGLHAADDLISLKNKTIGREELTSKNLNLDLIEAKAPHVLPIISAIAQKDARRAAIAAVYFLEMRVVIEEIYKVLKHGGHVILVIGSNTFCGLPMNTPRHLELFLRDAGFKRVMVLRDSITSRMLMTNRHETASLIETEHVLIYRKS